MYDGMYPWIRNLHGCPQDMARHAEGDVWTHVRMVCEAITGLDAWRALPEIERRILFTAALLHDVAKPACLRTEQDGRISARGHSWRGAIMARRILWRMNLPFAWREQVAALVRHHLVPLYLIEREDPLRLAIEVSQTARCDHLAILSESDARGRICPEPDKLLRNIARFAEFCQEKQCFERRYPFPSDHARFLYFHNTSEQPDCGAEEQFPCVVVLMSGLPGSGKDFWLQKNLQEWPIISLDELRQELGIMPNEPQGAVLNKARDLAREHLRARRSFVWNATNLSRQVRQECVRFYSEFGAKVRIVYREVPADRLFAQNRQRRNRVPVSVIERMLDRWEVPDCTEAQRVDLIVE
ncbi:MAG TPA: AAA family ATPase [Gemmataceae bacterium]|jgi:predicted kinase|nr:AAA family ATPase [Gemmataceae bacterium]